MQAADIQYEFQIHPFLAQDVSGSSDSMTVTTIIFVSSQDARHD
jgi:hypothetical protein